MPLTLDDETQITVPKNPKLIAAYSANKMYFNVLGDGGMHSALYKFNPTTPNVAPILVTEKAGGFAIGSQYLYTADIDWNTTDYKTIMQKVQLSNDDTSDFTDDPGYMFGFSVTVNPFNGDVCFGRINWETHCNIYDSAGGDYLDMVNNRHSQRERRSLVK